MRRRLTILVLGLHALAPTAAHAQNLPVPPGLPPAPAVDVEYSQTTLAPGLSLEQFTRVIGPERARVHALRADLSSPALTADLLFPGSVTTRERLSVMANRAGAFAGVNGDFFDLGSSNAPNGTAIAGGELLKSFDDDSETGGVRTAGITADERGYLGDAGFAGTLGLPGGQQPLSGLNRFRLPPQGIGLYTGRWGELPRQRPVESAESGAVRSVLVRAGSVVEVADGFRSGPIPIDGFELVGREAGAARLAELEPGASVDASYGATFTPPPPAALRMAVGGVAYLVRDGRVVEDTPKENVNRPFYPRTGIGFAGPDLRTLLLVTVDGRQATSSGINRTNDFAQLMLDLGAVEALHLDGGGSATMVARRPGDGQAGVVNEPSDGAEGVSAGPRDGQERSVPNGIGIFYDVDVAVDEDADGGSDGPGTGRPQVRLVLSCTRNGAVQAAVRGRDARDARRVAFRGERGVRSRDRSRPFRRTLRAGRFRGRRWVVRAGVRMRAGRLVRLKRSRRACAGSAQARGRARQRGTARRVPRFTG